MFPYGAIRFFQNIIAIFVRTLLGESYLKKTHLLKPLATNPTGFRVTCPAASAGRASYGSADPHPLPDPAHLQGRSLWVVLWSLCDKNWERSSTLAISEIWELFWCPLQQGSALVFCFELQLHQLFEGAARACSERLFGRAPTCTETSLEVAGTEGRDLRPVWPSFAPTVEGRCFEAFVQKTSPALTTWEEPCCVVQSDVCIEVIARMPLDKMPFFCPRLQSVRGLVTWR